MVIAIDIDEVLFPFVPELIKWHDEKYATKLKMGRFASYKFWHAWGGDKEQAIHKVIDYFLSEHADKVMPMMGAKEVLEELKNDGLKLFVVTSRQNEVMEVTEKRIVRHFPNIFTDIISVNHYSLSGTESLKSRVCRSIHAGMIIDDQIAHILDCKSAGIEPVLFGNYPWNQNKPKKVPCAADWLAVDKTLAGI